VDVTTWKRSAAEQAVEFVESGMVVGLGHGSTAAFAIERIAQLLRSGALRDIVAVPCSIEVARHAERLGIRLATLDDRPEVDVTIDGADEIDRQMNLIKGGGGALLREKVVASASRREIIVVDGSKLSALLGTRFAVPIEIVPFSAAPVGRRLESLGARVTRRGGDDPFLTDQGNWILDARFAPIADPPDLAGTLAAVPGIVAHGLFIGLATDLIVADARGVRHYRSDRDVPIDAS
jgi:ribose 5-phosphate isomerase A